MKSSSHRKKVKHRPYIPRVVINMNTGTRTIKSKKDKANSRQNLNKLTYGKDNED